MNVTNLVVKVFSARAYTYINPRTTNYVEINLPEALPTVPQDNNTTTITVNNSYTANANYPIGKNTVTVSHSITLPLLRGTTCPVIFRKGTPFLLFCPTGKYEEGYLMYI